jgi:hypothetical protein
VNRAIYPDDVARSSQSAIPAGITHGAAAGILISDRAWSPRAHDRHGNPEPRENHNTHRMPPASGTGSFALRSYGRTDLLWRLQMGRALILWLIGIPLPVILLLYLLGYLH